MNGYLRFTPNIPTGLQITCRDHCLTPYEPLYVELAMRSTYPLATLDQPQRDAAKTLAEVDSGVVFPDEQTLKPMNVLDRLKTGEQASCLVTRGRSDRAP